MTTETAAQHAYSYALLSQLAALGVGHVCISPGSRSTPLALAAQALQEVAIHVNHDERVGGFFGLGIAKASRKPVVLISTSGTAAVEYAPAVVEAAHSNTPLIVLTSDRPPEMQSVGAPQTINQVALYGDHVKWFHQATTPSSTSIEVGRAAALAEHVMLEASSSPAGPIHLNIPFREPLAPPEGLEYTSDQRNRHIVTAQRHPSPAELTAIADQLTGRAAMFVVGDTSSDPAPIAQLAVETGAVVLADVTSPLRSSAIAGTLAAAGDALAAAGVLDADPPDVVVRWGGLPTSKPVWSWLDEHPETNQIVIDDAGRIGFSRGRRLLVHADPAATAQTLTGEGIVCDKAYTQRWLDLDTAARQALRDALAEEQFPNEPAIASIVTNEMPRHRVLFAGSSMPIRDLDLVAVEPGRASSTFGNRGASGIDGSIATALGAAVTGPVVALIGDVAALYDLGGLAATAQRDLDLTIVVVHNDGGGIFSLLPQADPSRVAPETFEKVFGTPHGTDFVALATALGLRAANATSTDQLSELLQAAGPQLIQVRTDRAENVAVHSRIREAVGAAIERKRSEQT